MSNSKPKILFLMTGSIACYKACNVISQLVQNNCEVQVAASKSALEFIGTATLEGLTGKTVAADTFAQGHMMEHIHLVRWADLILVAPATAHFVNRIAQGVGDDLLSTLFLAHDFKKPFLIAPAMNTSMYQHPVTQSSIEKLKSMGLQILETASGVLACGETGFGKLLDPDLITKEVFENLNRTTFAISTSPSSAVSQNRPVVLVTGGGTQEKIDNVRSITNSSSGKTGYKIAQTLSALGADVTFVHSELLQTSTADAFAKKSFSDFISLDQQLQITLAEKKFTHIVHLAAVSDYSVDSVTIDNKSYTKQEFSKLESGHNVSLHLKENHKIIARLKSYAKNPDLSVIGFKLTSEADAETIKKSVAKVLEFSNLVVHNDTTEINKEKNEHRFHVYSRQNKIDCPDTHSLQQILSTFIFNGDHL